MLVDTPKNAIEYYQREAFKKTSVTGKGVDKKIHMEETEIINEDFTQKINMAREKDACGTKMGNQDAQIIRVRFFNGRFKETALFRTGEKLKVVVDYVVNKEIEDPHFSAPESPSPSWFHPS